MLSPVKSISDTKPRGARDTRLPKRRLGSRRRIWKSPSTALMPCESTVAAAAPPTPRLSRPINSKSSAILRKLLNITNNSGVTLLPTACIRLDSRLYAIVSGMPARITVRYVKAPSRMSAGICIASANAKRTSRKKMVITAAQSVESIVIQRTDCAIRTLSSAPK